MTAIDFSAVPSGVTVNEERIQYLSDRATETATAFSRKIEKLQAQVANARDAYSREAQDFVRGTPVEDRATILAASRRSAANKAANMYRQLLASSAEERAAMLTGLKTYADEAAALSSLYASPVSMLGRIALGDPKRTQYQLQLEGAGPVELETTARAAIMTNDLVLAAAIVTVVDRRPKERRPFSVAALAERMLGDVWGRMHAKLEGVQLAYRSAAEANREFERAKASPLSKIALALSRQAIAEAAGDDDEEAVA
ncbi:hypothetical protein MQE22_04165 [Acidithiobacillus sp. YTS05]|nr:hypothetical protein MQE22_04165 [Acidithiobacillus sp. YTS05]